MRNRERAETYDELRLCSSKIGDIVKNTIDGAGNVNFRQPHILNLPQDILFMATPPDSVHICNIKILPDSSVGQRKSRGKPKFLGVYVRGCQVNEVASLRIINTISGWHNRHLRPIQWQPADVAVRGLALHPYFQRYNLQTGADIVWNFRQIFFIVAGINTLVIPPRNAPIIFLLATNW